jgi:ABC-type glycerol-3-phosphate transport system substrate-binding protein
MRDMNRHGRLKWTAVLTTSAVMASVIAVGSAGAAVAQDELPKVVMWGWPTTVTRSLDANGDDVIVDLAREELGIDLEIVLTEQNELGAKLKASLPAGQGPDLLATDFDVMGPYWGFLEPLDTYAVAEWGEDWRSNYSQTALDEVQLVSEIAGKDGETLYLPGNMQLLGWAYYSRPLFEQAGVDVDSLQTYDDFIAACGQLQDAGITALGMGSHPAGLVDLYQTLSEVAAPGKFEQAQRGQASFADEDIASTFDLIAEVYNTCAQEGAIAADIGQVVFPGVFEGDMAMSLQFTGTPWFGFLNSPDNGGTDFVQNQAGTFLFPGSKGLAATDGGMSIVADSENKDLAWEVVKWISAGQEAERTASSEPVAWLAYPPQPTGTDFDTELQAPLLEALATGDNKFRRVLCPDVYNALETVIPGVISGQIDGGTAGLEVQDAFDRGCQEWAQ